MSCTACTDATPFQCASAYDAVRLPQGLCSTGTPILPFSLDCLESCVLSIALIMLQGEHNNGVLPLPAFPDLQYTAAKSTEASRGSKASSEAGGSKQEQVRTNRYCLLVLYIHADTIAMFDIDPSKLCPA